jgi:hypothetical protein
MTFLLSITKIITSKRNWIAALFAAGLLLSGFINSVQASIIEFDQIRDSNGAVVPTISGRAVESDYGDRITAAVMNVPGGQYTYSNGGEGFTPNIVSDFFAGSATPNSPGVGLWRDRYGDLINVLIGNNNSMSLNVLLAADAGFDVLLYNFDLAGWPAADYTISGVRIMDGVDILFSQLDVLVAGDDIGPGRTSFDFPSPLAGNELLIQIDYTNLPGSQQDNIGIDNIRFGQNPPAPIPLPATWLLFGSGAVVFAILRYRCFKCN